MVVLDRSCTVVFIGDKATVNGAAVITHLESLKYLNNVKCLQPVQKGFAVSFDDEEIPKKLLEMRDIQLEGRNVYVIRPGTARTIVKVFDLPYELDDKQVREMLEHYGEVLSLRRDKMITLPTVENGTRTALMILEDEVPNRVPFGKYIAKIWYPLIKKVCRICQEEGHIGIKCPEFKCRRCKKQGHYARNCPEPIICHNCDGEGHMARECMEEKRCMNCRDFGHYAASCTRVQSVEVVEVVEGVETSQASETVSIMQTDSQATSNYVSQMSGVALFTPEMLMGTAATGNPSYGGDTSNDDNGDYDYEDDDYDDNTTQSDSTLTPGQPPGQPPMKRNTRRPRGKKK